MKSEGEETKKTEVWLPGKQIEPGEELDYDSSAYTTFHRLRSDWPCLTFDILRDSLGTLRTKFPQTLYFAAGTQADSTNKNKVSLFKVSELHQTQHDEQDDSDDDDPEALDDDPILEDKSFAHNGAVNRLRSMMQHPHILATWSDQKMVYIWDTEKLLKSLDKPPDRLLPTTLQPIFSFQGHHDEGFAMDWSPTMAGRLLTGDCEKKIYLWEYKQSTWGVSQVPFTGHGGSVEDIQWSPNEATVFASCSVDRTIRIWDTRAPANKSMLMVLAHTSDVNVISWSRLTTHLLVSGSDDCSLKVWDLRNLKTGSPAAHYAWHKGAITSVEWHPTDDSVFAASSDDDSLSIWDMSLEPDTEAKSGQNEKNEKKKNKAENEEKLNVPDQLLFLHQGQKKMKELHFHPQIPSLIISTAQDGFNVFKPQNM